ncbi:MAG: hypothetical protein FWH37_08145 [Candidatus Bathyarchaeota archaeon]|nr:hypothetical protein [Candidatus Termiticorpusculum sp.]
MNKKNHELATTNNPQIDENLLFTQVAKIIERRKYCAIIHANQETTMMFWEVGQYINSVILNSKRATMVKRF